MTDRIQRLTELTMAGKMYATVTKTEFDRQDVFLDRIERECKQLSEYMQNQEPVLTEDCWMTGAMHFDESVVGDVFHRRGYKAMQSMMPEFYCKPIDNLSTFEWQHAAADFSRVLNRGIRGILSDIELSMTKHADTEKLRFLLGLRVVAQAIVDWAHKCSKRAKELASTVCHPEKKENLLMLAKALRKVPEHPPETFYEAVLTVFVCFSADPDSLGTLDRYLWAFYEKDVQKGDLPRERAKEYLQELFLMIQAYTSTDFGFTRGGQSHFCIGGYLENGEDGFTDLSRLILESMMELPIYLPEVTLRWTKKTPREVLRFVMDCERKDPNKRIAFTNDEKRIKCYTEICKLPYEKAVNYTMIGCNEPAFNGAITGANSNINLARCVDRLFHEKWETIENCADFDNFYLLFEKEFYADLKIGYDYDDKYNLIRSRDYSYISSLFFNDCIENATSVTQGGVNTVLCSPMLNAATNVIDSLIIVKQFVFDDKICTMRELIDAVRANFEGYAPLRTLILRRGDFFGNDTDRSNRMAQRFYDSLYRYLKDKKNVFGYPILVGDLCGEHEHNKIFGAKTRALPDGRLAGTPLKYGFGQSEGKDRNGLCAYLNSVAKADPNAIVCGSSVTNVLLDEQLIRNDENFEKTVDVFETYFKSGGVHFQLNYVSKEDLLAARESPESYCNLRVRVSGFSEYFVILEEGLQDDVIARTSQKS